jgi:hypothetical protein
MPWVSAKQRRWGNSPAGHKALGDKGVAEWNAASKSKKHKTYKGYTFKKDNKLRAFGETDDGKKVVKINKRINRKATLKKNKIVKRKKKDKYPNLADTIYHEKFHVDHPKATEKQTYKKTREAIKRMSKKEKKRLYSMLPK